MQAFENNGKPISAEEASKVEKADRPFEARESQSSLPRSGERGGNGNVVGALAPSPPTPLPRSGGEGRQWGTAAPNGGTSIAIE